MKKLMKMMQMIPISWIVKTSLTIINWRRKVKRDPLKCA